ncbi:MAG TPA: hypothetical protein VMS12_05460, partial [Thermoanaerobaculia bacterium]|nr:hypothetical protein [Thermoanaerobaculia bacterium]
TTFGSIVADVPQAPGYAVNARTSFGKISSSYPIAVQGEISNNVLRGKIGQGNCVLDLQNQNGNIQIGKGQ